MNFFFNDVLPIGLSGAMTVGILAGGVLYVHPAGPRIRKTFKEWKTTGIRVKRLALMQARAHKKRMAVYNEASEAKRKHIETRMVARQEARNHWLQEWEEAGAHPLELDPSFKKWTGEPQKVITWDDNNVMISSPVIGTRGSSEQPGHILTVGLRGEVHQVSNCPQCQENEKQRIGASASSAPRISVPNTITADKITVQYPVSPDYQIMSFDGQEALAASFSPDSTLRAASAIAKGREMLRTWVKTYPKKNPDQAVMEVARSLIHLLKARGEKAPLYVRTIASGVNPRALWQSLDKEYDLQATLSKDDWPIYTTLDNELNDFI